MVGDREHSNVEVTQVVDPFLFQHALRTSQKAAAVATRLSLALQLILSFHSR